MGLQFLMIILGCITAVRLPWSADDPFRAAEERQ
jgi:hypothetical protein